jgi:hypothetical protein
LNVSANREVYDQWIRNYLAPRYPELLPQLEKALKAFDAAIERGHLTHEELGCLVECTRSPRRPLGENAAALLGDLSGRFSPAAEAVREMAADAKVHVRVNALVALDSAAPSTLHDDVFRIALKDRSSRVRTLAADKLMLMGLRHLLSDLEQAIQHELDQTTKHQLEYERDLLRDGYHLRSYDDGRFWLTCRLSGGGGTTGAFVTAEDLSEKGAQVLARSLGGEVGS